LQVGDVDAGVETEVVVSSVVVVDSSVVVVSSVVEVVDSVLDVSSTEELVELSTSVAATREECEVATLVMPHAAPPDSTDTATADTTLMRRCLPSMRTFPGRSTSVLLSAAGGPVLKPEPQGASR
jgi:hypothetical protein